MFDLVCSLHMPLPFPSDDEPFDHSGPFRLDFHVVTTSFYVLKLDPPNADMQTPLPAVSASPR